MVVSALVALLVSPAFAKKRGDGGPCRKIRAACKDAGFKGRAKDCMRPLKESSDDESITAKLAELKLTSVSLEDVKACHAKVEKRKAKKAAKAAKVVPAQQDVPAAEAPASNQ